MNTTLTKNRIKKFLSYYKPHRKIFAIDLTFAAVSSLSVLLFPLISGYITKEALGGYSQEMVSNLLWAGAGMLLLTTVKIVSNIFYAWFGHAMGAKMEGSMREELFSHYEELSFDFHSKNSVGKLMTVISNDLTDMTELFHHAPEDILMTLIKFVGAFVILIQINVPLTLIMFATLPILCLAAFFFDRRMEKALLTIKANFAEMNEHTEDTLSGIRTLKAYGNEKIAARYFAEKNKKYTKSMCFFFRIEAYFYETFESFPQILTMLTVFFGALYIGKGSLDVPVLVTFLLYVSTLAEPVRTGLNFMRLYENGKAAFIRYMDMIETKPTVAECAKPLTMTQIKKIELKNVSFTYKNDADLILEDISLEIPTNQTVAFVGASGIGKTTISMLIARFYDVTKGKILLDGVDIKDFSLESLRKNIGMVQQEVHIFCGTIKDNIQVGKFDATDEEVIQAARNANIHDYIMSLPEQYDTLVGTKGIKLSGGQRQRISIARLFLKNPQIIILDEATSSLDYESEIMVQKSLEALMQKRTAIVIAHRLSTIKHANRIFVLADKRIVEEGTHYSLLAANGVYTKLCEMGKI